MKRLFAPIGLALALAAAVFPAAPMQVGYCRMMGVVASIGLGKATCDGSECCRKSCCAKEMKQTPGPFARADGTLEDCSCCVSGTVGGGSAPASVRQTETAAADLPAPASSDLPDLLDGPEAALAAPAAHPPGPPVLLRVHLRI